MLCFDTLSPAHCLPTHSCRQTWRKERRRGIWLKIKLVSIELMQPAIQAGRLQH